MGTAVCECLCDPFLGFIIDCPGRALLYVPPIHTHSVAGNTDTLHSFVVYFAAEGVCRATCDPVELRTFSDAPSVALRLCNQNGSRRSFLVWWSQCVSRFHHLVKVKRRIGAETQAAELMCTAYNFPSFGASIQRQTVQSMQRIFHSGLLTFQRDVLIATVWLPIDLSRPVYSPTVDLLF